jgi:uncharacterized membrane protein
MIRQHLYNLVKLSLIMAFIDFFYLNAMSSFFNTLVRSIQGSPIQLDFFATLVVYLFLVFQLYFFVLQQPYSNNTQLLLRAFLLGLSTYAVFEFTNKAIFSRWTYLATFYDSLWGGVLFALSSFFFIFI